MGKVVLDKTMSLDGFIAGPNDDVARLFEWYGGKPTVALRDLGDPLKTTGAVVMGANTAQQCLKAGLLDEIQIHLVPVLLGEGIRLFEHIGTLPIELERTRVIESPGVTHLWFLVVK